MAYTVVPKLGKNSVSNQISIRRLMKRLVSGMGGKLSFPPGTSEAFQPPILVVGWVAGIVMPSNLLYYSNVGNGWKADSGRCILAAEGNPLMPSTRPASQSRGKKRHETQGEFSLRKALFEIVIVAIGVLLALGVDEIRQTQSDRTLVREIDSSMRSEIEQNRVRLVTKLALLNQSFSALEADPTAGPKLVAQRANLQIELADAAWTMAQETSALRLMDAEKRQAFATAYASHAIYNGILSEEMSRWAELAASTANDRAVLIWKAYARRVGGGACISLMRLERIRNPGVPIARLQRGCADYTPSVPPELIYRRFGLQIPATRWRPGSDF